VLYDLTSVLFGDHFASVAVFSALGVNIFACPFFRKWSHRHQPIEFRTGQPLGYYSSWPLFALSHHVVVWAAADLVYPGKKFTRYAILGDDIVIADERVASEYKAMLAKLGVEVSTSKSITSHILRVAYNNSRKALRTRT
jgi:hypothetical protein